jgi:putative tryptophan/tyrosine transport system substrate-binding protein
LSRISSSCRSASATIPIVLAGTGNPVPAWLVASLAHPGANITGFIDSAPGVYDRRLGLLKQAFPQISRIAVFLQAEHPTTPGLWNAVHAD